MERGSSILMYMWYHIPVAVAPADAADSDNSSPDVLDRTDVVPLTGLLFFVL